MTNWKELIGKRVLVGKTWGNELIEVSVIEVSPSGERVKLRYASGYESWEQSDKYIAIAFPSREPREVSDVKKDQL